jgi:hypothetical protein
LLASEYWTTARNLAAGGGYKVPDGSDRAKIGVPYFVERVDQRLKVKHEHSDHPVPLAVTHRADSRGQKKRRDHGGARPKHLSVSPDNDCEQAVRGRYSLPKSDAGWSKKRGSSRSSSSGASFESPPRHHSTQRQQRESSDLVAALRGINMQKEVVPPEIYHARSAGSFKSFLHTYERYFTSKYERDEKDMARHLEKYLGTGMKHCYEAIDGRYRNYTEVRRELLDIVESEQLSKPEELYGKFQDIQMLPTDTMKTYIMRLERAARKAFRDEVEVERQLCRKLRETAPSRYTAMLAVARNTLTMLGQKTLNWEAFRRVADSYDHEIRESVTSRNSVKFEDPDAQVWYSRPTADRRPDVRPDAYTAPTTGSVSPSRVFRSTT